MKQYDKIFVPHNAKDHGVSMDDNYHVSHEGFMGPDMKQIEVVPELNVIVLTIEELKDLWNAGCQAMDEVNAHEYDEEYVRKTHDFESYLQSKGINI